jgi:hypothetical protein
VAGVEFERVEAKSLRRPRLFPPETVPKRAGALHVKGQRGDFPWK